MKNFLNRHIPRVNFVLTFLAFVGFLILAPFAAFMFDDPSPKNQFIYTFAYITFAMPVVLGMLFVAELIAAIKKSPKFKTFGLLLYAVLALYVVCGAMAFN